MPAAPFDERALAIASLMVAMAKQDMVFERVERRVLTQRLARLLDLSAERADALVTQVEKEVTGRDIKAIARGLAPRLDKAGGLAVMEGLWAVIMADDELGSDEILAIAELAEILGISQADTQKARVSALSGQRSS